MSPKALDLVADAPALVARMVERGFCSAPKFTPAWTDRQIMTMRRHAAGVTSRGEEPKLHLRDLRREHCRSSIPGLSIRMVQLLDDFLRQHEDVFDIDDFGRFLERSGKVYSRYTVKFYLQRAALAGRLERSSSPGRGIKALFKGKAK